MLVVNVDFGILKSEVNVVVTDESNIWLILVI